MRKLERKPLSDSIYKALLKKTLDGSFKPGQKLREEHLCKELGVSRTPLREALLRLSREGMLERQPNRGCAVRTPDARQITELMEFRSELECASLRRWGAKIKRASLERLKDGLLEMKAKGESLPRFRERLLEADEELHELVRDCCGNSFMKEQIERLQGLCRPFRVFRCEESQDIAGIVEERLAIVEAILDGDTTLAVKLLARHFIKSAKAFQP